MYVPDSFVYKAENYEMFHMVVPLTSISRCVETKRAPGGCSLTFTQDVMHDLGQSISLDPNPSHDLFATHRNTGSSINSGSSPLDPHATGPLQSNVQFDLCINLPPLTYFLLSAIVLEMECGFSAASVATQLAQYKLKRKQLVSLGSL